MAILALIVGLFAPTLVSGLILAGGLAMGGAQNWLTRRLDTAVGGYRKLLRHWERLAITRSATTSAALLCCMVYVPADWLILVAMCGVMAIVIDTLTMIALPYRVAISSAVLVSLAITPPLFLAGSTAHLLAGVAIPLVLTFAHWALINLHYMFVTRRLRTKVLNDAHETAMVLLNQYHEDSSDWLFECDPAGYIIRLNQRFCEATGRCAEELEGLHFPELFADETDAKETRRLLLAGKQIRKQPAAVKANDEQRWWSISWRPIHDHENRLAGWRGFVSDVTKTYVAEQKAAYMAHYDPLTHLANRSLFNTTLKRAFDRREKNRIMAILYIDLDYFKAINDTYGHKMGDRVLIEAAQRIEKVVPASSMVARLGGDEFVVLLDTIQSHEEAISIAEAIVSTIDKPFRISGIHLPLGTSVGIAFAPDNGLTGEDVLHAADLALYDAKAKGRRGTVLFDPVMQKLAQERRVLELELHAAISRGELELYYQPLLDIDSGRILGYEALLRWHHAERGSIEPSVFIPIAEATGQIEHIGAWALREALHEAATWPDHLFVSVNLSPAQMRDQNLIATIVNALAASGLEPGRLELEITETVLMHDSEENLAMLHKCRELGTKIALDDFGTGYSSLNYLLSFPFDKIKIDRRFVTNIGNNRDSQAIVDAVLRLAHELDMKTLAEGVENKEQLERLRQYGCDQVQGFLFSEALPASKLEHRKNRDAPQIPRRDNIARLPDAGGASKAVDPLLPDRRKVS